MTNPIPVNNYANHLDLDKAHHRAFLQALIDRVNRLDPAALQPGGDLRDIWIAAVETKPPSPKPNSSPPAQSASGAPVTWQSMIEMAKTAGARYPALVAAQGALESGWYKEVSGTHNYFGLKGDGTTKSTQEFIDGKWVTIKDGFINFNSPQEAVNYLVSRWYKDFKGYKGVNNAPNREAAARELVKQGYATDPQYASKLIRLMNEKSPATPVPSTVQLQQGGPLVAAAPSSTTNRTQWVTQVEVLNISQPDEVTCQAACIGMAVGDRNVQKIRRELIGRGKAGDPSTMAAVIRNYGRPYALDMNASLAKVYEWLKQGEFLITHGWFTGSGHVICLDGLKRASDRYLLDVKDPWSEFDAPSWAYKKSSKFYDGFYSDLCIYAACVAGTSVSDARRVYQAGKIDLNHGGMWAHRFLVK